MLRECWNHVKNNQVNGYSFPLIHTRHSCLCPCCGHHSYDPVTIFLFHYKKKPLVKILKLCHTEGHTLMQFSKCMSVVGISSFLCVILACSFMCRSHVTNQPFKKLSFMRKRVPNIRKMKNKIDESDFPDSLFKCLTYSSQCISFCGQFVPQITCWIG